MNKSNTKLYQILTKDLRGMTPASDIHHYEVKDHEIVIKKYDGTETSIPFTKEEDTFIKITSNGQNSLALTKSLLPGILKLKADNVFKEEISNIAEESSIVTEYIPQDENNYTVKCKIVEKTETIFEISTFAGSRERAKQISDNWKNNANMIYPKIINLLLNGEKNEEK